VMGCYTLAALVAVAVLRDKSWKVAGHGVCGVALGLGLASFWLIPAMYEQRWVEIGRAIGPLMHVEDSFLFGYVKLAGVSADERFDTVYHNQVLQLVSWIVVALMVGLAVAAWMGRRRRGTVWAPLVVVGAGVCALQLRWSDLVWRLLPELKYLQFPWRWMMVLGLVFAALVGLAIRSEQTTRRAVAARGLILLLVAGGMAMLSSRLFWQPCDEEDNVDAQVATFRARGFEGTDEYTPRGADNGEIQQGLPPVRLLKTPEAEEASDGGNPPWARDGAQEIPGSVKVERWDAERMTASVSGAIPGYAVLRLMEYPAWRVKLNGMDAGERPRRHDGLMVIPLAAGANRIDVYWHTTRDQWAGCGVSLAALAITLTLGWMGRQRPDGESFG
jgi:hypothetical protein